MNQNIEILRRKANNLPLLPGVYIMLDDKSRVIYVGKAKKLKNRVSSYFHGEHLPKVAAMVDKVSDFNVIVVNSEFEALVLENSLIKRHKPHYNILLKDDKGYPFIRISLQEEYPVMSLVNKPEKGNDRYFGPFGGRGVTGEIITSLNKALLLPQCSRKLPRDIGKDRPCLNYHIGNCDGWCREDMDPEEYRSRINQAVLVLEGKSDKVLEELTEKMQKAAEELRFEYAAKLRDRCRAIENLSNKQRVISGNVKNRELIDAIGFVRDSVSCFTVLHYSGGDLIDKYVEIIDDPVEEYAEAVSGLICRYYTTGDRILPASVMLPCEIEDREAVEEFLSGDTGKKLTVIVPQRGEKVRLLETAEMNAREEILRRTTENDRRLKTLGMLQKMLSLEKIPHRIEAFDVSNLGDTGIVSALTVHIDGKPCKKEYRKFRIRDLNVRDDYASMYQSVMRRFQRYIDGDDKFSAVPDILLIDGGYTHVEVAEKALSELGITIPVFGMVKDDRHRTRALISAHGEEIGISGTQSVFALIGSIQEETHRFAIEYQRSLREKSFKSSLDQIPGIGNKRKTALLNRFKTVRAIREADVQELAETVPLSTAQTIYDFYHSKE